MITGFSRFSFQYRFKYLQPNKRFTGFFKVFYSLLKQIDIDSELLKRFEQRAAPLAWDYLSRREKPLIIDAYYGSVDSPHECLLNSDVVVAVEL